MRDDAACRSALSANGAGDHGRGGGLADRKENERGLGVPEVV